MVESIQVLRGYALNARWYVSAPIGDLVDEGGVGRGEGGLVGLTEDGHEDANQEGDDHG